MCAPDRVSNVRDLVQMKDADYYAAGSLRYLKKKIERKTLQDAPVFS